MKAWRNFWSSTTMTGFTPSDSIFWNTFWEQLVKGKQWIWCQNDLQRSSTPNSSNWIMKIWKRKT
jgi:hypothetical protein